MICRELCPAGIIMKNEETGFPCVPDRLAVQCIRCGHCEAACPDNAVTINHPSLQDAPDLPTEYKIAPEQLAAYCLRRRSVRRYRQNPVDRPILNNLFDIVRYAPSAVNRQSVKWIVVHTTSKVQELSNAAMAWIDEADRQKSLLAERLHFGLLLESWRKGRDPIFRNAPHLAIACVQSADRMAAGDAGIALSHLELAAPVFGLGACWAGYFTLAVSASPSLKAMIELPPDHAAIGTMMLGYPAVRYYRIPKRNPAAITWK
jgi:nitroreductase/NAD-dependent dihydropyrimidine dehydrogenase PreA subunit